MSERRRFNASERAALYLAADGRCASCGRELRDRPPVRGRIEKGPRRPPGGRMTANSAIHSNPF